jgi:RNA polymerase sigma factor (sigma-70 family)
MIYELQNHKAQLRSYVIKRIDDVDAVDDILQDVYIKASSNLHQLKSKGSLKGWLYRIAHNTIMDFYRTRQPYEALPEDLIAEEQESGKEALEELAQCLRPSNVMRCLKNMASHYVCRSLKGYRSKALLICLVCHFLALKAEYKEVALNFENI